MAETERMLNTIASYNRSVGFISIFVLTIAISSIVSLAVFLGIEPTATVLFWILLPPWLVLVTDAFLLFLDPLLMEHYLEELMAEKRKSGLPVDALKGVRSIEEMARYELKYSGIILLMASLSFLMFLAGVTWSVLCLHLSMILVLLLLAFTSIGKRKYYYGPDEILEAYEPEVSPVVLKSVIYDFLSYVLDPFTRLKLDEFKAFVNERRKPELSFGDVISKMFFLMYLREQGTINDEVVKAELEEVLKDPSHVEEIGTHPVLGFRYLRKLISRGRRLVKSFFILLDRLYVDVYDNLPEFRGKELYADFEADRDVEVGSTCNALVLLYNNLPVEKKARIYYEAEGFEPSFGSFLITLPERDFELPERDRLPVHDREAPDTGDVVGLVSRVLDNARVVWLPLVARDVGVRNISVVVEDEDGTVLYGESHKVCVHYSLTSVLRALLGYVGPAAGLISYVLRILI